MRKPLNLFPYIVYFNEGMNDIANRIWPIARKAYIRPTLCRPKVYRCKVVGLVVHRTSNVVRVRIITALCIATWHDVENSIIIAIF